MVCSLHIQRSRLGTETVLKHSRNSIFASARKVIVNKIPFSVYDFFAYLSSGVVLMAAVDQVWGNGVLAQKEINVTLGIVLIITAYITGHVVAHFSSFLFEQVVVHRILRSPAWLLLGRKPRWKPLRWVFPNYHRPLSDNTQKRVREQAVARGCNAEDEGLFQHAYPIITANESIQARLDTFRNQYGFARNVSFSCFLAAIVISIGHWCSHRPMQLRWAVFSTIFGITLFYRYLKFFRQYTYELFLRYSGLPLPTKETA